MQRHYKLFKSPPNNRKICNITSPIQSFPSKVDLSPNMPPPLDQLNLGACASNAASNIIRYLQKKENIPEIQPSRLYLYWNTRVNIEGNSPNEDSGVCIRDICKAIKDYEACDETIWPYDITKFSHSPPLEAYKKADLYSFIKYAYVPQDLNCVKSMLSTGNPLLIALQIFTSFESDEVAKTGIVPIPDLRHETSMGWHAIILTGYDDETKMFTCLNSWGSWGKNGFCKIPYAYILDNFLAGDFWVISLTKKNYLDKNYLDKTNMDNNMDNECPTDEPCNDCKDYEE